MRAAGCTRKRTQRSGRCGAAGGRHKLQRLGVGCKRAEPGAGRPEGCQAASAEGPALERPRSRESCTRDSSRLGAWTPGEKQGLLDLVAEMEPCGAADWEVRPPLKLCSLHYAKGDMSRGIVRNLLCTCSSRASRERMPAHAHYVWVWRVSRRHPCCADVPG